MNALMLVLCPACLSRNDLLAFIQNKKQVYFCRTCQHVWDEPSADQNHKRVEGASVSEANAS